MHHPEVDISSRCPLACGSNCANSGHVMFFCCWFWRKALKCSNFLKYNIYIYIDQLVPKDKLVICIYIYTFSVFIQLHYTSSHICCASSTTFPVFGPNLPCDTGGSTNAAVEVRERHLCATTSWVEAAQRGTWRWWWKNEGYGQDHGRDDGMMGWWLRLWLLSLLVSKCQGLFFCLAVAG